MSLSHNRTLGVNPYSWLALVLVVLFTVLGVWFGTPDPVSGETFAGTLRRFGTDDKTRAIIGFILVDVVTGIMCALRLRIFDMQRIADFYKSNVVPYILGYLLVWVLTLLGLDGVLSPPIQLGLVSLGFATIQTTLTASIIDNLQRMTTPLSFTKTSDAGVAQPPADPQG